jgi:hypothetical protein
MSGAIRQRIEADYITYKTKLGIVIFGSYEPAAELTRLQTLKDYLISCGYANTTLVRDYPDDIIPPAITNTTERVYAKSIHLCKISHCNFVVATHDGRGRGWINELCFCCRDLHDGVAKTVVFDEMRSSQSALGTVNLGMVSLTGMRLEQFSNDDELKKAGESAALKHVIRLLDILSSS